MKYFILSLAFINVSFAQVQLNNFSANEVITKEDINENFSNINTYLTKFNQNISFNNLTSNQIKSSDFNQTISAVNTKFTKTYPLIQSGSSVSAQLLNTFFSNIITSIDEQVAVANCDLIVNKQTGLTKVDTDGIIGPLNPKNIYCNYLYSAAQRNQFRIRSYSSDWERSSRNYVYVNETAIFDTGNRGWRLTILDEALNSVYSVNHDTYNGVGNTNILINFLNTTTIRKGLVIFTTSDEPLANGSGNINLRNAIQNYSGCAASIIATVGERNAYSCISQIKPSGVKQVLFQSRGVDTVYADFYIDYASYYNFLNQ